MFKFGAVLSLLMLSSSVAQIPKPGRQAQVQITVGMATAHTLHLVTQCSDLYRCVQPQWTLKELGSNLRPPINETESNAVSFTGLIPSTKYLVTATTIRDANNITAETCPERPPGVNELRVVSAGLGWLEVRWRPPVEKCHSKLLYFFRYGPAGTNFSSALRVAKVVPGKEGGYIPVHPCPPWPNDFCLLLTDEVKPHTKHVIEVYVARQGGDPSERTGPQSVTATAEDWSPREPPVFAWSVPAPRWRPPGTAGGRARGECATWAGVAIGAGVTVIIAAFVMALFTIRKKKEKYDARVAQRLALENAANNESTTPETNANESAVVNNETGTGENANSNDEGATANEAEVTEDSSNPPQTSVIATVEADVSATGVNAGVDATSDSVDATTAIVEANVKATEDNAGVNTSSDCIDPVDERFLPTSKDEH